MAMWACDAAQSFLPQALALAVLALIAVMPEYAVDMYSTWQAGQDPDSSYAHYAIANMTGANRLIIGLAWVLIVVIVFLKNRKALTLTPNNRLEISYLGLATVYAFFIPIKGTLEWYDAIVLVGIYIAYLRLAAKQPRAEIELENGPPASITKLPMLPRVLVTILMFAFAGLVILFNIEPFSESLVATGRIFDINEFLLVQWLAPIASELPEFTVAVMFAMRGLSGVAMQSLLSAKLNQWTLLMGTIPIVFSISSGSIKKHLPMDSLQLHEILLTAAQSLLAVAFLCRLRLSIIPGIILFILFAGQLTAPVWVEQTPYLASRSITSDDIHVYFSFVYLVLAAIYLIRHRQTIPPLLKALHRPQKTATPPTAAPLP